LNFDRNIYIKEELLIKHKQDLLINGEVLFNNTNSQDLVGKTTYYDLNGKYFASNHITRLGLKSELVLTKYVWIVLNIYQRHKIFYCICTNWNNQSGVNANLLGSLKFPLPSLTIQKKIVDIYNEAIRKKQVSSLQSKRLLDSIDDYLLEELRIKLPNTPSNILKNRTFVKTSLELCGSRFDAFYHQNYFDSIRKAVQNAHNVSKPLKDIILNNLVKGRLPNEEQKIGSYKVIQISCIDSNGNINWNDILTAKDIYIAQQKLKQNDILIVITGATIGKIAFWNLEGEYYLGGDIVKFQTQKEVDPYYVYSYLRSLIPQIEIKRYITGATNGHLSPHDIKNILIPLPPIHIQKHISKHILEIRTKVTRAEEKANIRLDLAKKEVENLILNL